mmetsp:Transcript_20897/g.34470  ORF Transcript_20897/g.34470 Transcript_20897/m.34470 type:complete len:220 (-) Transcript_20897:75-734(-)
MPSNFHHLLSLGALMAAAFLDAPQIFVFNTLLNRTQRFVVTVQEVERVGDEVFDTNGGSPPLNSKIINRVERVRARFTERHRREQREEKQKEYWQRLHEIHRNDIGFVFVLVSVLTRTTSTPTRLHPEEHVENVFRRQIFCIHRMPIARAGVGARPLRWFVSVPIVVRALFWIRQHLECLRDVFESTLGNLLLVRILVWMPFQSLFTVSLLYICLARVA